MPRSGKFVVLTAIASLLGAALSLAGSRIAVIGGGESSSTSPITIRSDLDALRRSGDLKLQRRHGWEVLAQVTRPLANGLPAFDAWHGEDETLRSAFTTTGIHGFVRGSSSGFSQPSETVQAADASVLTYTFFNQAAFEHIRDNRLNRRADLQALQTRGPADTMVAGARSVTPFPKKAVIVKTVWWPVAASGFTPLPVWDPELNPPNSMGNDYTSWRRVVAIDPTNGGASQDESVSVEFAGTSFPHARRIDIADFFNLRVDADLARRLNADRSTRKAATIALGRELRVGDSLIFVAGNVATKEIPDWVWLAFWWHDRPQEGPHADDRPAALSRQSAQFLMQVAFDASLPRDASGQPHVCFNPWLEARFPEGGRGGGTVSNCLACHSRASFPPTGFLPVTRGAPEMSLDQAYAADRLRTNFLWSLPLHAN